MTISDVARQYEQWSPKQETVLNEKHAVDIPGKIAHLPKHLNKIIEDYFQSTLGLSVTAELRKESAHGALNTFLDAIPRTDYLARHLENGNHFFAVQYTSEIAQTLIDFYYGGGFETDFSAKEEKKTFGYFDSGALNQIAKKVFLLFSDNLIEAPISGTEEKVPEDLYCYLFSIHFKEKSDSFSLTIMISQDLLEDYFNAEKKQHVKSKNIDIKETIIQVSNILFSAKVDLSYVMHLSVGDLIPIDANDKVSIKVNETEILKGKLGTMNQQKAIKINSNHSELADEIWKKAT